MSAVICAECGHIFSSDDDPDCFMVISKKDVVVCEQCRENVFIAGDDCTCTTRYPSPTDIDPPETLIDPWCPEHGHRDPDREYEERRDDSFFEAMVEICRPVRS